MGRMNKKTEHLIQNDPQIVKIFSALSYHIISLCGKRTKNTIPLFFNLHDKDLFGYMKIFLN